jgi:hypothetical protein
MASLHEWLGQAERLLRNVEHVVRGVTVTRRLGLRRCFTITQNAPAP